MLILQFYALISLKQSLYAENTICHIFWSIDYTNLCIDFT